jgi:hypothetical protein
MNSGRKPVVVDTNVLCAANSVEKCWQPISAACAARLDEVRKGGLLCIDDGYRILAEYGKQLSSRSARGHGDAFFKWVMQRWKNPEFCCRVQLTARGTDDCDFVEFPPLTPAELPMIDRSDRKFIAVAYAHPKKPQIVEATDSKWIGWEDALGRCGVRISFVDRSFIQAIYSRKMGG